TAEGPGDMNWMAMECVDALSDPPRPTIRWIPENDDTPPAELMERGSLSANEDDEFDEEHLTDEPIGGKPFVDPEFDDDEFLEDEAFLDDDLDGDDLDGDNSGSADDDTVI
ncbi:MAG: hypothetical protein GY924_27960, partial [Planctomycetaceae bacterium]|nr:hypothetical protein [Planctomycetaceae bacterium]